MKKWILKAIIQKTISYFPYNQRINYLFQKHITKGVVLTDEHFNNKLIHANDHLKYFAKYGQQAFGDSICLELGSGWYPIIPISMFLAGFRQIVSLDISPWMTKKQIIETIKQFNRKISTPHFSEIKIHFKDDRLKQLIDIEAIAYQLTFNDLCKKLNFNLLIKDARNTGFETNSIEYICSNNTFEHIYPHFLEKILEEFNKILKTGGVMSHFIDMSDHFAHFDKSISIYNFLKFSDKTWNIIDNTIQPQNRLRYKDYIEMYNLLEIPLTFETYREGDIKTISKLKLNKKYQHQSYNELAISHCHLVSNKK